LVASPGIAQVGETITLTLTSYGSVYSGTVNGVSVGVPYGSTTLTPGSQGTFTMQGYVYGPGGSSTCTATIQVE
jgi:hypothetical protein